VNTTALACKLCIEAKPGGGYVVSGQHGERCEFFANEVVTPAHIGDEACPGFRAAVLRIWGAGGPRRLQARTSFDPLSGAPADFPVPMQVYELEAVPRE
jgi:hypothetical protein